MKTLKKEFDEIVASGEDKIKSLDSQLSEGFFHTFLNLKQEYGKFIKKLSKLFRKNNYIVSEEMYDYFYQLNCKKYNLLFSYSEYVYGSGLLPGAFLEEAIRDLELDCIFDLFCLERENDFFSKRNGDVYSLKLIDVILQTKEHYVGLVGYKYNDITMSEDYLFAAEEILREYKAKVIDKASNYYEKSLACLNKASASCQFESFIYYSYYIKLNKVLVSYKRAILEYGMISKIDIDKELFDCNYSNYREAQTHVKKAMTNQITNLINQKNFDEAIKLAKENIVICEERVQNYCFNGIKLSLQQAYELLLSIPTLSAQDQTNFGNKLLDFKKTMTHDDYFVKDGDKEFPAYPM